MTTVVQTTYKPQIAAAVAGMIAEMSGSEVDTRICETPAGIGFGLAVSQGVGDQGCVLGGSAFYGITLRDVTLDRLPIDPLAPAGTLLPVDTYAQYQNMAVLTRGTVWVLSAGGVIAPGSALFYDTTLGKFTNSASGSAAVGSVAFTTQPVDGQTISINGSTWTFKASGATGLQSNIGPTLGDTIANLANALNASADVNTVLLSYRAYPPSPGGAGQGSGANTLMMAVKLVGVAGNAYTLSTNVPGATASGATLSGGTAAATAVTGGFWKTSAIGGQLAKVSLGIQR